MKWSVDWIDGRIALTGERTGGSWTSDRHIATALSFQVISKWYDIIGVYEESPRKALLEILPGHAKLIERVCLHKAKRALEDLR